MKGDFTRDTFDLTNHFSRVLMQQGRVTLDADANEQTSILLHYIRTLVSDLIGPHAAPKEGGGFKLSWDPSKGLLISEGRYYVDGILVENEEECSYNSQTDFPLPEPDKLDAELKNKDGETRFWIYLDVWERHITAIENDTIREKALGETDTCTRAKVVWQVKAIPWAESDEEAAFKKQLAELEAQLKKLKDQLAITTQPVQKKALEMKILLLERKIQNLKDSKEALETKCQAPLSGRVSISDAQLSARVDPQTQIVDACITPPESKYRGVENQLYRVEIHQVGIGDQIGFNSTFKWARDNGSIASAWLGVFGNDLQVANARGFAANQWVELTDDEKELQGAPGMLVKLVKVEGDRLSVDSSTVPGAGLGWSPQLSNPKVRRWDQKQTDDIVLFKGAIPIKEGADTWIDLEDGVQVRFSSGGEYRSGDYWLIPARVAGGLLEWPITESNEPQPLSPHGIHHHYAPLGFAAWEADEFKIKPCRCEFEPGTVCAAAESAIEESAEKIVRTAPKKAGPGRRPK